MFGTFNSLLSGCGRNQVCGACYSAQFISLDQFKTVKKTRQQALRAYCPDIYTVIGMDISLKAQIAIENALE